MKAQNSGRKETAELHIFTNRDLLHKKSWSNFVIDIFHGQTLALVHETCWLTSEKKKIPLKLCAIFAPSPWAFFEISITLTICNQKIITFEEILCNSAVSFLENPKPPS